MGTKDHFYSHPSNSTGSGRQRLSQAVYDYDSLSPVLSGLASKGERIIQVPQPGVPAEASIKLTSYCQKQVLEVLSLDGKHMETTGVTTSSDFFEELSGAINFVMADG
jgi:hypothetical protein